MGRWQAEDFEMRELKLAQLARGVPPSKVDANLQDIFGKLGLDVPGVSDRWAREMRGEVTIAGEAMAAYKLASCQRVLCFGWDESTKFGDAVFACNFQIEYANGTREDVCPRGLSILPSGGTSKAVLEHIEKRILAFSRRSLVLLQEMYESHNGEGSWERDGHPSPENIGLHRLAEFTVLMSDTCNGARCTKRLLAQARGLPCLACRMVT